MISRARLAALLVVAASTSAAAGGAPRSGLFATQDYDRRITTIYRLAPGGIEQVATYVPASPRSAGEFGWSDGSTLWVLGTERDDDGQYTRTSLVKLVDGKLVETIDAGALDWRVGKPADELDLELVITAAGEVWVEHCVRRTDTLFNDHCLNGIYVRVDSKPFVRTTTKPRRIDAYRVAKNGQDGAPRPFPPAKAPRGYTLKLTNVRITYAGRPRTVEGAICTDPAGRSEEWAGSIEDQTRSVKVTWLRSSPAVARISARETNPAGIVETNDYYLVECKLVSEVENFGQGIWGVYRDDRWSLYRDDKHLGTVGTGSHIRVAP